jgi:quercetin dioxygenase-like cupin family protein
MSNTTFRRTYVALAFALIVSDIATADATHVTPPQSSHTTITRVEIGRSDVPGTTLETRLYLITFPPGVAAPLHHHPVEGIGYIVKGTARTAFGNDAPITLSEGESFHDKAKTPHTIFANVDTQHPLVFVVAYTIEKGKAAVETP